MRTTLRSAIPGAPNPIGDEVFSDILRYLAVQSCRRELLRCRCGGRCRECQGWRAFVLANTGRPEVRR